MLHRTVVFVGDRPNPRQNLDVNVPFVGTKSYKTLLEWCYRMDLDVNRIRTYNAFSVEGEPRLYLESYHPTEEFRFVALGEAAATRMFVEGIKHFKLPHPSPRNVALNDKQEVARLLYRCKKFIYKTK